LRQCGKAARQMAKTSVAARKYDNMIPYRTTAER